MNQSNSRTEIKKFLTRCIGIDEETSDESTVIIGNGLLDSFGLVALLGEIEKRFGVFPDLMSRDPTIFSTLGGMTSIVVESLNNGVEGTQDHEVLEVAELDQDGLDVRRLTAVSPLWCQVPQLFVQMFEDFTSAGLLLPLVPGGEKLWLQGMERLSDTVAIVTGASIGRDLIGFAAAQCKMMPAHLGGKLVGEISYIYVLPNWRRSGIARRLVKDMQNWFVERKVSSIELQVLAGNSGARDFWKRLEFSEELVQMRLNLGF
jgi:ribosomal protein S18 acetylase RimI-like enzyme/acyl carrier protein